MQHDVEERIRHRAYLIWLEEGKPHGRDAEHWARAQAEVTADTGAPAPAAMDPVEVAEEKPKRRTTRKKVETSADGEAAPAKAPRKRTTKAAAAAEGGDAPKPKRTTRRKKTEDV
ncbi:DUF2934 domain-containing protein [Roseospira navarrensis]|uniref:DUF2934 domain-containing protein n=1 Tax=Roseospira navarrensis TaxID=140058 RepID=A0A7X1ZDT9_9PROT|nr:DUF2934 domain-containing protein [Roseospira navarrensis]MQX35370.1 DUF2934 domain-containing protein [Roseospira navarrensis]